MAELIVAPNLSDPDGFYSELLSLHEGRSEAESAAINAKIVLVLANHVGDRDVLRAAFAAVARTL